jgi:hypothetical protein
MPAKITFRLYGYNSTVSSGGLNRFVYDQIVANGSTLLPVGFDYFKIKGSNSFATISWKLSDDENISTLFIERASNGSLFEQIKSFTSDQLDPGVAHTYFEQLSNPGGLYAYRIMLRSPDGHISYSGIETVSFETSKGFSMRSVNQGNSRVSFIVSIEKSGNYSFSISNLNGSPVMIKQMQLVRGTQTIQMDNNPLKSGIYILHGEYADQKISTKIMVL